MFDREEGNVHERRVLVGGEKAGEVWGQEVTSLVEARMREERRVRGYRSEVLPPLE